MSRPRRPHSLLTFRSTLFLALSATVALGACGNNSDDPAGPDASGEVGDDIDADGFPGGDGPDCNDEDPSVHPEAYDPYYDGVDQDCDGESDYDADRDGHDHVAWGGTDCNDDDPAIHPGIIEVYYDGIDADCRGDSDFDADGDGRDAEDYGGNDCDDTDRRTFPGAPELCDMADNDCNDLVDDNPLDPITWYVDDDNDGYGNPDAWALACFEGPGVAGNGDDCDDADPMVNPSAAEIWYDGIDQDCDRRDDDRDGDGYGFATDCDDLRAEAWPGAPELRNDLDDDCDGYPESADRDDDQLIDWDEWQLITGMDDPDSDNDTVLDGDEAPGGKPIDSDGDGLIDPLDPDDDDDGLRTAYELSIDVDGDGHPDHDIDRDRIPNHLDDDTDGDGWTDLEEGRGDRDGDGIPDFADYTGAFGGGGCGGGESSAAGFLLLLPLLLRRRGWAVLGLTAAGPALAQDELDAHAHEVLGTSGDVRGHTRVLEAGTIRKGVVAGTLVDLANKPLVEELPSGDAPVVRGLLTATPYLSVSPANRIRIDATLPVHAYGWGPEQRITTAGDLRIGAAVDVLPQLGLRPGVTVLGTGWVPTGAEASFVGLPTAAGGAVVAVSQRIGPIGWTLNGGARFTPRRDIRDQPVGPGPLGGMALQVAPWERMALVAEAAVDGTSGMGLPVELGGGVRAQGPRGRFWTVTAGAGLTGGLSVAGVDDAGAAEGVPEEKTTARTTVPASSSTAAAAAIQRPRSPRKIAHMLHCGATGRSRTRAEVPGVSPGQRGVTPRCLGGRAGRGCRNQPLGPETVEQAEEGVFRASVPGEASEAALAHIGDHFKVPAKITVCVPPGGEPCEVGLDQPMTGGDVGPETLLSEHLLFQRTGLPCVAYGFDAEIGGQRGPHAPPAEGVAVDDVVGLVAHSVGGGRPDHVFGQQPAVRHVRKAVPLRLGAGEDERLPEFPADGCLDGERETHVHGIADRMPDYRVRAVHGPAKALVPGGSPQLVFLGVVEVGRRQPRLAFAEGSIRHLPRRIRFKRAQIVLQPGHEGHMLHRMAAEAGQQVPQHGRVGLDVFLFRVHP